MKDQANYQSPTAETYGGLDRAFSHFNEQLFESRLPEVMFTIHRKRNAKGYFWAEQFHTKGFEDRLDEIALNPESMGREIEDVLSTLVHEMTHLEQQHFGKPGKSGNHNKEWGTLMDRVGLEPTSTGAPGGKRTGRKVTHMIVPDGPFAISCAELVATGFDLPYFTKPPEKAEKKKDLSKVPHVCPECSAKVWGKLGIRVECADCEEMMEAQL